MGLVIILEDALLRRERPLILPTELLLLEVVAESVYISNLLPAPQYSYLLPGQVNEQSAWLVAKTDPVFMVLPQ